MSKLSTHLLPPAGTIPNNPNLPLLVYESAFPEGVSATEIEKTFQECGWQNTWVNGVFSYHHFHSNAHEVLGCFAGSAEVQFGGPEGPIIALQAGAGVVIPAGVGHCERSSSNDFGVVGAYPPGPDNDVKGEDSSHLEKHLQNIAAVPLPETDPVHGPGGPLFDHWR